MIDDLDSEFRETISKLNQRSTIYSEILIAMTKENRLIKIGNFIGKDITHYIRQLNYLIKIGMIIKTKRGVYKHTEPIFKAWLERNFITTI